MIRNLIRGLFVLSLTLCFGFPATHAQRRANASESNSGSVSGQKEGGEAIEGKSPAVGSPYVELDSWIYPAIERLAALGYIHTQFLGMRPWTRLECAFSVQEAGEELESSGSPIPEASYLRDELKKNFNSR
jgi:hypothetical protein